MKLTAARLTLVGAVLVVGVALIVFSRARTLSSVCEGQSQITRTINGHDKALREFIAAGVDARRAQARLAHREGNLADAALQHSIAVRYAEIGGRFTGLPAPSC